MFHQNMAPNNGDGDNNENNNNNNNINGGTGFGNEDLETEIQEEVTGNNQDPRLTSTTKKRYHRHSQHQIQEMEAFFKECPHPDDKQRRELSRQLGLDHLQIKFWFQNKRTQSKNQHERYENTHLRTENDRMRTDNHRYRDALFRALCPKCGGQTAFGDVSLEEQRLRLENARIAQEIEKVSALAANFNPNKPIMTSVLPSRPVPPQHVEVGMGSNGGDVNGNVGNLSSLVELVDAVKPMIIELAVEAMEELLIMAQMSEPLWVGGVNGTSKHLKSDEYIRMFGMSLGPRPRGFKAEASRDIAMVAMNPMHIAEMFMNENQWSTMFAGLVAKAITHAELSTGYSGNSDGTLKIMSAEFQVLSPLVSTRESYFVRYCKNQGQGLWAVVDVSIDHFLPNIPTKCRRRPSGCLIQETQSGYSKVVWVEHMEVDYRGAVLSLYKHLIFSGQAFSASRWVSTLNRQCERLASIMTTNLQPVDPSDQLNITNQGKMNVLKLAERMTKNFFAGMTFAMGSTSSGTAGDNLRVMTMQSINDPGRPPGVVLCVVTSFWLPASPKTIFDFLRDENNRLEWDVFSTGSVIKLSQIANGIDNRNCVTILRNANTSQNNMMTIQESSTDPTASFVIYAPIDAAATENVINVGDSDYVTLLPAGFAILPDGMTPPGAHERGGSLVTVAFQILVDSLESGQLTMSSVATAENLIRATVLKMKALYPCQTAC